MWVVERPGQTIVMMMMMMMMMMTWSIIYREKIVILMTDCVRIHVYAHNAVCATPNLRVDTEGWLDYLSFTYT